MTTAATRAGVVSLAVLTALAPTPAWASEPEGPRPAPTADVETDVPEPAPRCWTVKRCRQLAVLASVSGALGTAAIITGAVYASRPDEPIPGTESSYRTTKPVGVTVAVLGGAVLATGVVMLAAALRSRKNARRHSVNAAVATRPAPRP